MAASRLGHLFVIQELISQGADVNARNNYNKKAIDMIPRVEWGACGVYNMDKLQEMKNSGISVKTKANGVDCMEVLELVNKWEPIRKVLLQAGLTQSTPNSVIGFATKNSKGTSTAMKKAIVERDWDWDTIIEKGLNTPCESTCIDLYKRQEIKEGVTFRECSKAFCK